MSNREPGNEQRYEIKIPIEGAPLYQVKRWIHCHPSFFKTLFPRRQVNNVYFDTNDLYAYQNHLDGYADRIKYRLRWYGGKDAFHTSQFELKIKNGKVGCKKNYSINASFDLENDSWGKIKAKIIENIPEYQGEQVALQNPVLINRYQREYFHSFDKKIRLTLDYDLRYLDQRFFTSPNLHYPSPTETMIILELKAGTEHYKEIIQTVSSFPVRGGSISKFITGISAAVGT